MVTIKENERLAPYTVYKIGGNARYFVEAGSAEDLCEALSWAKKNSLPFVIIGAGSNVLISDAGFAGLVIRPAGGNLQIEGERVTADAGATLARLVHAAVSAGLTGIEWAIGIPGSVGGSVRGNAGCFGGEMRDVVETVRVYDTNRREEFVLPGGRAEFGYRDSIFKRHPDWVVLSATFKLARGDMSRSQEIVREFAARRTQSQAIGSKSCGCIFKNIPWDRKGIDKHKISARFPGIPPSGTVDGIPVSYLMSEAGLKKQRIGDIEVSSRHANYFINHGNGTAEEVVMLIALAKERVHRKFGLLLEEEIQYIGF